MKLFTLVGVLLLAGCASTVPDAVRLDVGKKISVAQAQEQPQKHRDKRVRWGGEILSVRNHSRFSDVVILRRALFQDGEPRPDGGEGKRFVARFQGFVDPAEYLPQKRLTVVGKLHGTEVIPVGEYPYVHPVVLVEQSHRWPKFQPVPEPRWHRDPFYCDPIHPWGDPWGYRRPFCW